MKSMDTNRGGEAASGRHRPPAAGNQVSFKQRRGDRRGEGGLFGYQGPDRRSGVERRANG